MHETNPNVSYDRWLVELAGRRQFGAFDRLGTANYIDAAARLRAAEAIETGVCISLARPVVDELHAPVVDAMHASSRAVSVDVSHSQISSFGRRPPFAGAPLDAGSDVTHIRAHGQLNTHLDAINHVGRGGTWYNGYSVDDANAPSLEDIANHRLFTRGVLVDIPAVRGTEWVDANHPVQGSDIDAALSATGTRFEPGDALLLYMGRDRFERSMDPVDVSTGDPTPGAGSGAAKWIVEHNVSMVCWDFAEAAGIHEPVLHLHMLIWAIGLLLVDHAHLGEAAERVRRSGRATAGFVVAPAAIPRATGSLVQPLFIQ